MANHRVTKTTSQGYFSRIGNSIKGILVGLLMVAISFPLLFWNEGRAVVTAKSLEEGAAAVVTIEPGELDPSNDGNLVHFTGDTEVEDTISDSEFPITVEAVALKREVEMYQWKEDQQSETREKLGGGTETVTTYDYSRDWSSTVIDSSRFEQTGGHENPGSMPYQSEETFSTDVTVGAFALSDGLIRQIRNFQTHSLNDEFFDELPSNLQERSQMQGSTLYIGENPGSPEVGDVRISFSVAPVGTVSIISEQDGNHLTPYQTDAGRALEFLSVGRHSAEAMFEAEMQANVILTWGLRFAGFMLMFFGFGLILGPIAIIASVIPFMGRIVGFGTNLVAGAMAASLSLITIAIGWIFYRPLLGILLLLGAGIITGLTIFLISKKAPVPPEEAAASQGGIDGNIG